MRKHRATDAGKARLALLSSSMSDPRGLAVPSAWAGPLRVWCSHLTVAGRSAETIKLRRAHISQLARAMGGDPCGVEEEQLLQWLAERTWSRETRRAWRASLRAFFAHVGRRDLVEALPRVRPADPMPRPAPDPVLDAAMVEADERTRLILRLAAEAGLRRAEIAQVHIDDIEPDLVGLSLRVMGKGGRERVVPISNGLAAAIKLRAGRGGWAFPGDENGHLSPKWVGTLAVRVLPAGWTLHTLRHRFATRAHERGGQDLLAVSRLLGHASVATTQRYVATDAARLRRVAEAAA